MDVYWYDSKYKFKDFDNNNLKSLRQDLEFEFDVESSRSTNFQQFQQIVFNIIQKLRYFGNISRGKCDIITLWRNFFTNKIIPKGMYGYNQYCSNKKFYDLFNFFDNIDKWYNPEKFEKEEAKHHWSVPYIQMLGLQEGFTKSDLRRKYRKLVLIHHPDKGGSQDEFLAIHEAYKMLLKVAK